MVNGGFVTWDLSDDMRLYCDVIGLRVFHDVIVHGTTEKKDAKRGSSAKAHL